MLKMTRIRCQGQPGVFGGVLWSLPKHIPIINCMSHKFDISLYQKNNRKYNCKYCPHLKC